MRVLHFASWYPNEVHPQLGNFVRRHIEAIPAGVESRVVHAWPGLSGDMEPSIDLDHVGSSQHIQTHFLPVVDAIPRRWRMANAYNRFCRRLESEGWTPDLIHLHIAAEAAEPAASWAKRWNVPLVVSENWTAYHSENGRAFRHKERRAMRRALRFSALHLPVSLHLGKAMARFADQVPQRVVPNVVDRCFSFVEMPTSQGPSGGPLSLLHVSSLVDDHKNIEGMLRAMAGAVEQGVDFVLNVFGGAGKGGDQVESYRAIAQTLGISSRIKFHGAASAKEVAQAMRNADAFVLFSRYENLPCVLLEAWSTGLPVVATNVGGVGEHLKDRPELGMLIESEDEPALIQAILHFARRKMEGDLPKPETIAAHAEARFSVQAVGTQIMDAYRSVLK